MSQVKLNEHEYFITLALASLIFFTFGYFLALRKCMQTCCFCWAVHTLRYKQLFLLYNSMGSSSTSKISGRLSTRIVGILEMISGICLFGIWVRITIINAARDNKDTAFFIVLVLSGVYFMAGIVGSFLLTYATFAHASLKIRRRFAIGWTIYRSVSVFGAIILMCSTKWFTEIEWFLLLCGLVLKWLIFICILCTYIWGLSGAIQRTIIRVSKVSSLANSTTSVKSTIVSPQKMQQWQQIQVTKNYGMFASNKQLC